VCQLEIILMSPKKNFPFGSKSQEYSDKDD